jgi:peptidoglycan hydrolase-like protein with peptidoglycan-binding domain
MPFDSFTNRPGARSGSRRRPDPFGRLLADPGPDLDILDFNTPFRIRDSVGMEGLNGRRDVAKVESLLGRAGTLDLAKTDGITGFFGARTDEAVKKFQKDRGLKGDDLITPNGPTLKTLIAQTGEYGPPKVLPTPRRPFNPTPGPPREAVRYAASRLLQLQKVGIDPRAQLLARQLAQAEPGAKTPDKPSSSPQGAGPGKGTSQDSGADLMDRFREIIDELKKNPDPQGGDIDTDEPEAKVEKSRKTRPSPISRSE